MPELLPSARAAGTVAFTSDPHNGGPCDCRGAAALLRHRTLSFPDQSRYGHGKPVKFNHRRSLSWTQEGGGHVVTCLGCGWMAFDADKGVVSKRAQGHEKCPTSKGKRK